MIKHDERLNITDCLSHGRQKRFSYCWTSESGNFFNALKFDATLAQHITKSRPAIKIRKDEYSMYDVGVDKCLWCGTFPHDR